MSLESLTVAVFFWLGGYMPPTETFKGVRGQDARDPQHNHQCLLAPTIALSSQGQGSDKPDLRLPISVQVRQLQNRLEQKGDERCCGVQWCLGLLGAGRHYCRFLGTAGDIGSCWGGCMFLGLLGAAIGFWELLRVLGGAGASWSLRTTVV